MLRVLYNLLKRLLAKKERSPISVFYKEKQIGTQPGERGREGIEGRKRGAHQHPWWWELGKRWSLAVQPFPTTSPPSRLVVRAQDSMETQDYRCLFEGGPQPQVFTTCSWVNSPGVQGVFHRPASSASLCAPKEAPSALYSVTQGQRPKESLLRVSQVAWLLQRIIPVIPGIRLTNRPRGVPRSRNVQPKEPEAKARGRDAWELTGGSARLVAPGYPSLRRISARGQLSPARATQGLAPRHHPSPSRRSAQEAEVIQSVPRPAPGEGFCPGPAARPGHEG